MNIELKGNKLQQVFTRNKDEELILINQIDDSTNISSGDSIYSEEDIKKAERVMDEMERYMDELNDSDLYMHDIVRLACSVVFALIVTVVFFIVFALSNGIMNVDVKGIPYLIDSILSNVILIFGGAISVWTYQGLSIMIFKIVKRENIRKAIDLKIEDRMWIFLLVFWGYCLLGIEDVRIQPITSIALSLIIGKFFWVDGKLSDTLDLLKTIKNQSWIIKTSYLIFLVALGCSYFHTSRVTFLIWTGVVCIPWIVFSLLQGIKKWGIHMQKFLKENNISFENNEQ